MESERIAKEVVENSFMILGEGKSVATPIYLGFEAVTLQWS